MTVIPYSSTQQYTDKIHPDDVFVIEEHGSGFSGMKKITVGDFLQPVYDRIISALTSMYKFMGSVETYEDLPEYDEPQDPIPVYGILSGEHAGENWAFVTDHWERFATDVDLSGYVTEEEFDETLKGYAPSSHVHTQSQIKDLDVVESLTLVSSSEESGGSNIFSVQKTRGTFQNFTIKNGEAGSDSINYRIIGTGSITRNLDGSYSPEYLYLQSQKLTTEIEAYYGRILISSEVNDEWVTVYPTSPAQWEDQAFLQFYIPDNSTQLRVRLYKSGTDYSDISSDSLLYEEHVSIAQVGARGAAAKSVEIESDSYVFRANENGVIQEPEKINFTAKLQNTSGVPIWTAYNGSVTVKTGSGEFFSISKADMDPYTSITVTVICDGISDTCSVVKVSDGSDGESSVSVVCSNEAFVIPTDSKGNTKSSFSTEVSFSGFLGATPSNCIVQSVEGLPTGMRFSINKNTVIISAPISTKITSDFGNIDIEVLCESKSFIKTIGWSIAKDGESAKSISIEADSYVFKANSSGVIQEPDKITFTANLQNLTSVVGWTATNGETVVKRGNGNTFIISSSDIGSYKNLKVQAICEDYYDTATIMILSDGTSGYSTAQIRLLKRSDIIPQNFSGDQATYTFSTGTLDFGIGSDDGWSVDIPSGSGNLYVIYASAHSQESTDVIYPNEWTTPVILSEESVVGQNGYSVATVFAYCRSKSQPETPTLNVSYSFEGGEISGLTGDWSKTIPTGSDDLWVIQATAFSRTSSDIITPEEWSTPVIMFSSGTSYNTAQLILWKRSSQVPSSYSGGIVTYDFSNATYSFGVGGNDGWNQTPPTGAGDLYIIIFAASSDSQTISILPNQWTAPQLYMIEPSNGASGYNSATVFIYTRSVNKPSVPSTDVTYVFDTGNIANLPAPWFKSPPAGELKLWFSQATAFSQNESALISNSRWSDPVVLVENGTVGSSGWSSVQAILWKRSSTTPELYAGTTATYDFSTAKITFAGDSDGWSQTPPTGNENLYVITAPVSSQSNTDTIASNEWSEPLLYSAKASDGMPGLNGYNVATVHIYKRAEVVPSTPSKDSTYTFSDGSITGLSDGWSAVVPNGSGILWTTQATAFSRSTTDVIESSQWTVPPTVMAKDGEDGINGINIVCTNETFLIPTDKDGKTVEAFNTEVSFLGYAGTEPKTVVLSDISNVPEGMSVTSIGNTLSIIVLRNITLSDDHGYINLTALCDGGQFAKSVSWAKTKQGADGEKGETGSIWLQGTVLVGENFCTGVAGNEGDFYLNNNTCNVYKCVVSGNEDTAVWQYEMNIKGDKGESFSISISSSNGSIFRIENVATTLSCHVYKNATEITDALNSYRFKWKRTSTDPADDIRWNNLGKAIGHKTVNITPADCFGRTVFSCEVDLSDF